MDLTTGLYFLGIIIFAYLMGSFPTGFVLVKLIKGEDIRNIGSGSTGATNVKRVLGMKGFIAVMLIDGFKALLPVLGAKYLEVKLGIFPELHILPVIVAITVLIGHSKSIFLGFTGGKSVASAGGTLFALYWPVGVLTLLVWTVMTYFTKIVSSSSITVLILAPVWMYVFKQPLSYVIYCAVGAVYVVYLHRENIKRLLKGEENKFRS